MGIIFPFRDSFDNATVTQKLQMLVAVWSNLRQYYAGTWSLGRFLFLLSFYFALFFYQSEWTENWQSFHIGEAKLYQAERHNKAIKDIPAFLEIIVRIHCNNFQKHFCCKDPGEDLRSKQNYSNAISDEKVEWHSICF